MPKNGRYKLKIILSKDKSHSKVIAKQSNNKYKYTKEPNTPNYFMVVNYQGIVPMNYGVLSFKSMGIKPI